MQFTIREAVLEDAQSIAALSAELATVLRGIGNPIGASLSPETLVRDAMGPSPAVSPLVAEADHSIVGYLLFHPSYDPDLGGRVFTVVDLYVRPSARRAGIGRALMNAAGARCSAAGGHALVWWLRDANRDAVHFYESIGASVARGLLSMSLRVGRGPTSR